MFAAPVNDHWDRAGKEWTCGNVVVSALFWPPLEVHPSLALSWTSVTLRHLDRRDEVNLKLILLLFPFKIHIKLNGAP